MSDQSRVVRKIATVIAIGLAIVIAGWSAPAGAGEQEWREGEGEVYITQMSPERARDLAFDRARAKAAEAGIRELSSVKVLLETDTSSLLTNRVSSKVFTRILEEDTLFNAQVLVDEGGQRLSKWIARVRALVLVDDSYQSTPYTFACQLDKTNFVEGDAVVITVQPALDSYVHIFNITADNRVLQLYPTAVNPQRLIKAKSTFTYPDDNTHLRVYPLDGYAESDEEIRIVVTKEPIQFFFTEVDTVHGGPGFIDLSAMDVTTLETKIASIPFNERSEATLTYSVRARYDNRHGQRNR